MMSKKFHVAVLLSAFVAAGAGAPPFDAGVSRAEVNADLAAWKQAGPDKLSGGDAGPDTFSLNTAKLTKTTCNFVWEPTTVSPPL